jgi:hypothetical protein
MPSSWQPGGGSAASMPSSSRCGPQWPDSPARFCAPASAPAALAPGPRSDHTIETALATIRDLAVFLHRDRGKDYWAQQPLHIPLRDGCSFPAGLLILVAAPHFRLIVQGGEPDLGLPSDLAHGRDCAPDCGSTSSQKSGDSIFSSSAAMSPRRRASIADSLGGAGR